MLNASLPWYDFPSTEKCLDSVYRQIRHHLIDSGSINSGYSELPEQLDRLTPLAEQWSDDSLILSQCCGPDLQTSAGRALEVIARPVFNSLDCPEGSYFSHIVSRSKNLTATPNIVVNATSSFSGCTALLNWLESTGREHSQFRISGSHQGSIKQLLSGEADVAAIDAYTWQFINHHGLVAIDRSESALTPPFVCHANCHIDRPTLANSIAMAFQQRGRRLHITEVLPADNYLYRSTTAEKLAATSHRTHTANLRQRPGTSSHLVSN